MCGLEMHFKPLKGRGKPSLSTYTCPTHRKSHTAHRIHDNWVCQDCIDSAEPVSSPIAHPPPPPRPPTPPLPIPPHPMATYHEASSLDHLKTFSSRCGFNDFWLGERDDRTASIDAKLSPISNDTNSKFLDEWKSSSRSSKNCEVFICPVCACISTGRTKIGNEIAHLSLAALESQGIHPSLSARKW